MNTPAPKQERFHFLDGLRGIASLMIVFHHAFTSNLAKLLDMAHLSVPAYYFRYFTQSGVELFFVLSGVVLLRPYIRKQRQFKTLDYFFRRIKRIYPPYLGALVFALLVSWYITVTPTWYSQLVYHMYPDVMETIHHLPIINFNGFYYNLAWWSLGIEILFYLLVPVCLLVFPSYHNLSNVRVTIMLVLTLSVSVAIQLWLSAYHPSLYDYKHTVVNIFQAVCYPVCFLMGMLLAAKDFDVPQARVFMIIGTILVLSSWYYLPLGNAGYGLLYAGIVILSFRLQKFRVWLSRPIMIWLGERSYSIFLVHFSAFYFADNLVATFTERNLAYGILSRVIGIPLAFIIALLLFHFVERRQARGLVTGHLFWPWQVKKLDI